MSSAMIHFLYMLIGFVLLSPFVAADTDIINFRLPLDGPPVTPPEGIKVATLTASQKQIELLVSNDVPDVWVELDTELVGDHWTARMSWPGSMPTRFTTNIYPNVQGLALLHIHAEPLSPRIRDHFLLRTDSASAESLPSDKSECLEVDDHDETRCMTMANRYVNDDGNDLTFNTTFHLRLERLLFGAIPETAASLLGTMAAAFIGAILFVPVATRALRLIIVRAAMKDMATTQGRSTQTDAKGIIDATTDVTSGAHDVKGKTKKEDNTGMESDSSPSDTTDQNKDRETSTGVSSGTSSVKPGSDCASVLAQPSPQKQTDNGLTDVFTSDDKNAPSSSDGVLEFKATESFDHLADL